MKEVFKVVKWEERKEREGRSLEVGFGLCLFE